MRNSFLKVGVLTVLILSLCTVSGLSSLAKANGDQRGSLQVSGSAVIAGAPDIAYITLGVETKDPSADTAAQDNAERMARVFAALKDLGLTDKELTTSGYNIYSSSQVIARGTDNEITTTTYHVQNRINITTKELDSVGQIIDVAVKMGANQVQGIRFDIEDKQAMQLEALKAAVQQGRAKADVMAEAAGVAIGGIASASENYSSYAPVMNTMALKADFVGGTTINPGEVEVSATVQLNFWF